MTSQALNPAETYGYAIPKSSCENLQKAARSRQLRTGAAIAVAVSGALVSNTWLAVTISIAFTTIGIWRDSQLRSPHPREKPNTEHRTYERM